MFLPQRGRMSAQLTGEGETACSIRRQLPPFLPHPSAAPPGSGGPYGGDLIRRFAPPSPCAGKALGRRGRRPLRRGPHPALRATFPVCGEGFGPPGSVGPYGGDLIRRFAPPSPCAGKALGRRCRDPSSAKQSLERRALPARLDAPQADSEGHSRNSERTPNSAIPNASSRPGSGKRLAWRGGICYHTGSNKAQEERSLEHS